MDENLFIRTPPPLNPLWREYERKAGFTKQPLYKNPIEHQSAYSEACKLRNVTMLKGRDRHLAVGILVQDSTITGTGGCQIATRTYKVEANAHLEETVAAEDHLVIYYHGGGLRVGDLDSEDLSCRRICKETLSTVISVNYRLMPVHHPSLAVQDAFDGFKSIATGSGARTLILVGSSSGGQLSAQVSQLAQANKLAKWKGIDGLLLRCPVTCDPTENGKHLPERFRSLHTSFSSAFATSLVSLPADGTATVATSLPLDAETFEGLPRTFLQQCTNDVYYSDGICYAKALNDAGVEVKLDVLEGWPHTFWLKAPELDRALRAERDMIEGLKWLQQKALGLID